LSRLIEYTSINYKGREMRMKEDIEMKATQLGLQPTRKLAPYRNPRYYVNLNDR